MRESTMEKIYEVSKESYAQRVGALSFQKLGFRNIKQLSPFGTTGGLLEKRRDLNGGEKSRPKATKKRQKKETE